MINKDAQETALLKAWDARKAATTEKRRIAAAIITRAGWDVSLTALAKATAEIYAVLHPDTKCGGATYDTVRPARDAALPDHVKYDHGKRLVYKESGHVIEPRPIPTGVVRAVLEEVYGTTLPKPPKPPKRVREPAIPTPVRLPPMPNPTAGSDDLMAAVVASLRRDGFTEITIQLHGETGYRYTAFGPGRVVGGGK